jgi:hypothetical protein
MRTPEKSHPKDRSIFPRTSGGMRSPGEELLSGRRMERTSSLCLEKGGISRFALAGLFIRTGFVIFANIRIVILSFGGQEHRFPAPVAACFVCHHFTTTESRHQRLFLIFKAVVPLRRATFENTGQAPANIHYGFGYNLSDVRTGTTPWDRKGEKSWSNTGD